MPKTIPMKTYPHYAKLPTTLANNLNILRTNVFEEVEGNCPISFVVDGNDIEFLSLEVLVDWVKTTLPDYDRDFLEAAARIHHECYYLELFDYFAVEEEDLFQELLHVKDAYELKMTQE